ncbi:VOC family protein [Streptomyces sp. NBC_01012]|uniref:VOC family protein n=1 Tax=Streptomyces sp. NBC_01012 TaxID=2903717 RepID=UPI0038669F09|nr:VOC family protein [Streptomyces sp. NBC_01012]
MNFSLASLVVEAADLESEGAFWHGLLGGSLTRTATHHFVQTDGLPVIVVQHSPGHVPPQWPDGSSQQMHFDLFTDDAASADARVTAAGGRRLRPTDDVGSAARQGSRVYASPAGHPFCVRSS